MRNRRICLKKKSSPRRFPGGEKAGYPWAATQLAGPYLLPFQGMENSTGQTWQGSSGILVANFDGRSNMERLGSECENQ